MNKPPLKLAFVDFWDSFRETAFAQFLAWFASHFDVCIDEETPDVVVYSCFGTRHLQYYKLYEFDSHLITTLGVPWHNEIMPHVYPKV